MHEAPAPTMQHLLDTRRAFDGVADAYDGPVGNNLLVRRMRAQLIETVAARLPPGSRLLDLGCGTGLDAVELARRGYRVTAIDWSPEMVRRTRSRACEYGLGDRVLAHVLGIHELGRLDATFDGIYSNLGPLNCVPDLGEAARACAGLLPPGGSVIASVIGGLCPWEIAYYAAVGHPRRALLRLSRRAVPVGLAGQTVWTRYYTPRQLYRHFAAWFSLVSYSGLGVAVPPPYLLGLYERLGPLGRLLDKLDGLLGTAPCIRNLGDHVLVEMVRRG